MMAKKKILVVEDNMLNREMLKNILFPEYEMAPWYAPRPCRPGV